MSHSISTAVFLHEMFIENDMITPNQAYTAYREMVKTYNKERRKRKQWGSYANFRKYFYILTKLGLIEHVKTIKPKSGEPMIPKHYYRAFKDKLQSEAWERPQQTLYPNTAYGGKKYREQVHGTKRRKINAAKMPQL